MERISERRREFFGVAVLILLFAWGFESRPLALLGVAVLVLVGIAAAGDPVSRRRAAAPREPRP